MHSRTWLHIYCIWRRHRWPWSSWWLSCRFSSLPWNKMIRLYSIIKRWSEAESFTIFENHVYTSKKNLTFARNFVTTPFLGGFFFLKLHKQKFARNFVATPFLGGSFFSYTTHAKVCKKYCSNPIFGRKFFFICNTGKNMHKWYKYTEHETIRMRKNIAKIIYLHKKICKLRLHGPVT